MQAVGRWLWAGLILVLAVACDANPTPAPTPAPSVASDKIGSILADMLSIYTERGKNAALAYARDNGLLTAANEVTFEVRLHTADDAQTIAARITQLGGRVLATEGTLVDVAVPVDTFVSAASRTAFVQQLADLPAVADIHNIVRGQPQDFVTLPQTRAALRALVARSPNEGVHVIGADAWQSAGFTGKGVKIGIIDGGYRYAGTLRGDSLPADFAPKDFSTTDPLLDSTVHGSAVAEVLHSVAPDATLLATAVSTETEFAQAARWLLGQGVSIISTSMGFPGGPGDGDPALSLADATAATIAQAGVLLVAASGNNGLSHYAGRFDPDAAGFHQFTPGVTRMAFGYPTEHGPAFNQIVLLNWQAWDAYQAHRSVPDLDLFIEDDAGNVVASSTDSQTAQPPREYVQLKMALGKTYYARVRLKPGTPPPTQPLILHLEATNGPPVQFSVARGSASVAPGDSPAALTVGGVVWSKETIAYYSSQGPTVDGRLKPEIAGPTEVSNTAAERDGQPNFNGTSAATPHIAAAAALLKGANPSLSRDQLRDILLGRARDLGSPGPDDAYGYGLASLGAPGDATPVAALPTPAPDTAPPPPPHLNPQWAVPQGSATSLPTASISQTPRPLNALRVVDDFSADSHLPNSTAYRAGAYHIAATTPGQFIWATYPDSVTAFSADVAFLPPATTSGGFYGLVFWQSDARHYFCACIADGPHPRIGLTFYNNGQWQPVIAWTDVAAAGPTTLRVRGTPDGTVSISLNDAPPLSGQTEAGRSGAYGFAAGLASGASAPTYDVAVRTFRLADE